MSITCPHMSKPQVIVFAHPSLKHVHQRLMTFLYFIQRSGTTARKLCTTLFGHLVLSFRFLLSRWQILCQKQMRRGVNFSSLVLIKPKINESGSKINAGQSQVSCGLSRSTLTLQELQPITNEQIIPLNNLALSLYPSTIERHDGSSSGPSQTLNAILQSPEILSPSED